MENKQDTVRTNSKTRILESALNIFSQKGYEGAGVSEIVKEAGITKPTLYYFFTNKEGLYKAIWETNIENFIENLESSAKYKAKQDEYYEDVYPVLCKVVDTFFNFAKTNPKFYFHALSVTYSPETIASAKIGLEYYKIIFQIILNMFEQMGQAHGGIKNREYQIAVSFVGMINSYITCWRLKTYELNKESTNSVVRQFMHGIFS